jgi:hypothetical protein
MDIEHGRIDPLSVDRQPTLKKENCELEGLFDAKPNY